MGLPFDLEVTTKDWSLQEKVRYPRPCKYCFNSGNSMIISLILICELSGLLPSQGLMCLCVSRTGWWKRAIWLRMHAVIFAYVTLLLSPNQRRTGSQSIDHFLHLYSVFCSNCMIFFLSPGQTRHSVSSPSPFKWYLPLFCSTLCAPGKPPFFHLCLNCHFLNSLYLVHATMFLGEKN